MHERVRSSSLHSGYGADHLTICGWLFAGSAASDSAQNEQANADSPSGPSPHRSRSRHDEPRSSKRHDVAEGGALRRSDSSGSSARRGGVRGRP